MSESSRESLRGRETEYDENSSAAVTVSSDAFSMERADRVRRSAASVPLATETHEEDSRADALASCAEAQGGGRVRKQAGQFLAAQLLTRQLKSTVGTRNLQASAAEPASTSYELQNRTHAPQLGTVHPKLSHTLPVRDTTRSSRVQTQLPVTAPRSISASGRVATCGAARGPA
jgi:hypothetical protein